MQNDSFKSWEYLRFSEKTMRGGSLAIEFIKKRGYITHNNPVNRGKVAKCRKNENRKLSPMK